MNRKDVDTILVLLWTIAIVTISLQLLALFQLVRIIP